MSYMTCDTWHVTRDIWHVTCCGGWTFSQNFSSPALRIFDLWYFEDLEEKDDSLTHWINYEGVCWTAPDTPGLLITLKGIQTKPPNIIIFIVRKLEFLWWIVSIWALVEPTLQKHLLILVLISTQRRKWITLFSSDSHICQTHKLATPAYCSIIMLAKNIHLPMKNIFEDLDKYVEGNRTIADLRYGEKDIFSPSTLICAQKRANYVYMLSISPLRYCRS